MASLEIHRPWTLRGLIGAFVDLTLAYFLLCASTFMFFASKILGIVGLRLPCPCHGVFGYRSADFCWHRLLGEWPVRIIHSVHMLVKSRFPFDWVLTESENGRDSSKKFDRDGNRENRVVEVDSEPCSSSFSGPRSQNLVDRESGCGVKGKMLTSPKQRPGIRRRRRAALLYGNFASVAPIFPSSCDVRSENEVKFSENFSRISAKDSDARDYLCTPSEICKDEATCCGLESNGSFTDSNDTANHSVCFEKYMNDNNGKRSAIASESDKIRALERALAAEKDACASLSLELEKERAAAATAADEAMAMISRLQKDKASMEIETRQYGRMIEEKFAYDEEEIDILKEILVRRERENHFLEKEIETYRRMSVTGDEQSNDDISDTLDDWGQRTLSSPYSSTNPQLPNTVYHKNYVDSETDFPSKVPFVEKQSQSNGHELIEETVILVDHVHSVKLDSMPEDMNSCHDSNEN